MANPASVSATSVILDGLTDVALGRRLSGAWLSMGLGNQVDVAGQSARLWTQDQRGQPEPLNEAQMDRAADLARRLGLEIRDRAGDTYRPDNELAALRKKITYEYKSRFATALVFGLPALAVHLVGRFLAGGASTPRAMLYPWLFECLLVGWMMLAAGWPILWQALYAARHGRLTTDLYTSAVAVVSFVSSAAGLLMLLFNDTPWFGVSVSGGDSGGSGVTSGGGGGGASGGPAFHAAMWVITLAVLGRWLVHRRADALAGRMTQMVRPIRLLLIGWTGLAVVTAAVSDWRQGLAIALLLPPILPHMGINPLTPRGMAVLPLFGLAILIWLGPARFGIPVTALIDVAGCFQLFQLLSAAWAWRGLQAIGHTP